MLQAFFDSIKKKLVSITNLFLVLFILFLALSLIRNVLKMREVNEQIEEKDKLIEKVRKENEKLEKQLSFVKSEEFMEKQLRDKLGLAKEGEIIVVLPPEEELKKYAPKVIKEEEVLPDSTWKKWAKLFGLI